MSANKHIAAALESIRAERRQIDARIREQAPEIEGIAANGRSAEARDLARRWLKAAGTYKGERSATET